MGQKSQIEWTDSTWNPWHGCVKVSPGCKFCYMYRAKTRYRQDPAIVERSKTKFKEPLKWKEPMMVFTCSWSDFFIEQADEWRAEAWEIIKATPHLTYQILTKRPERIKNCLPSDWGTGYPNVWLGVSGEDESTTYKRLFILKEIPAVLKFLSAEPLLQPIHTARVMELIKEIDWVIIGGESSPAEFTNDFNPDRPAKYHLQAEEFCNTIEGQFKGVLFDPPYNLSQLKECYDFVGLDKISKNDTLYFPQNVKKAIAPKIIPGGLAISFGWNSQGFGKSLGFEIIEVLIVPHGRSHNDTIVTVERKFLTGLKFNPNR